ncbi:MAG: HNH endonuclease [Acidobacteria bacterium]|nr:HNH endonuclease [Acidobacteriota bacterium]
MRETELREIFAKTNGHCHFCGDLVDFGKRGWDLDLSGRWEVDHVIQRGKGGLRSPANCLPACTRCNRLRWHRTGDAVRELLFLGLIARDEIKRGTILGRGLAELQNRRLNQNANRRRGARGYPAARDD